MGNKKTRTEIREDFPLRSVVKCHCGKPLTGAPSRGRHGRYFNYYKCNVKSGHNNISAKKMHAQLFEILQILKLPSDLVAELEKQTDSILKALLDDNGKQFRQRKRDLAKVMEDMESLEKKYIQNQVNEEVYKRWHEKLAAERNKLSLKIEELKSIQSATATLLTTELNQVFNLAYLYSIADTSQKQNLVRIIFDDSLYYKNGIFYSPVILSFYEMYAQVLENQHLLLYQPRKNAA